MLGVTDSTGNVKPKDGRHCDLCGCTSPAVRCDRCNSQIFCLSCDDMYHRHPKRRFHLRKAVDPIHTQSARPVLPMKIANLPVAPGDPSKMPLPPPRKKKPTKSFFDTFRRGTVPSDANPNLPKKEYSWSDRFGSIKKFMSQRPLPPVPPDDDPENFPPEADVNARGDFSFIHTKANDKPPALPERNQQKSPDGSFQKPFNGTAQSENITHQNGVSHRSHLNNVHPEMTDQWHGHPVDRKHSLQLPPKTSENAQNFGSLRRSSQPPLRSASPPANAEDKMQGGMHQSSSATDLQALSMMGMPSYPQYPYAPPMPPQYPGAYPMYPQYPGYLQYFGNSWANLSSAPQTTDGDFSDQSETSGIQLMNSRNMGYRDKKAKRSHSVVVDRAHYQGQFYPYGPYPHGGYPPPPWIPGHRPKDAPPSPATSMRSLSRLSQSYQKKKLADDGEEDDFSSSSLSRPKSSSSDMSKTRPTRRRESSSSTSADESEGDRCRPRASPAMERRLLKQEMLRRRNSSPRQASASQESPITGRRPSAEHRKVGKLQSLKASQKEKPGTPDDEANKSKIKKKVQRKEEKDLTSSENESQSPVGKQISPQPTAGRWYCKHCTFLNEPGERICRVCCKTGVKTDESSCESPQNNKQISADIEQQKIEKNKELEKKKQEITSLNSALAEAEREISRSLGELLKIKEESNEEDLPESRIESENKQISSVNQTQNIPKSNEPEKSPVHRTSTGTSPIQNNRQPRNVQLETNGIDKNTSTPTANQNKSLTIQSENVENNTAVTNDDKNVEDQTRKDSFCQTYQDVVLPEYPASKQPSDQPGQQAAQQDRSMNLQSPSPYEFNNPDRGFNGFFGMQRAHSRASLFGGRMNDASPMASEYGNMGFIPPTMYRSLSRTSLLGENEGWTSEYYNRNKPDFYLSMEELVERRRQETMRAQGLELVRMIREAEQQGFTADDIQVALNNCGKQNPVTWLQDNWKNMIHTVVTLATNYGRDKKENDIGGISQIEARDALRLHKGNIWAAVTECVESRQRKFLELSARGNFSIATIADALTASKGDVEMAYSELTKTCLKPFLMRIWGSGEGAQNLDAAYPENFNHEVSHEDAGVGEEKFSIKNNESDSDQEIWEDGDYDEEVEGEWEEYDENKNNLEETEGNMTKQLASLERMNSNPSDAEKSSTLTSILTVESDISEYCDAFGSALSERYLSSTSIDEIYLLGVEDNEDMQQDIDEKQDTKAKGTGFLKQLADLKKSGSSKLDNLIKFDNEKVEKISKDADENNSLLNESQNLNETKKVKEKTDTFNPLGVLKKTFSSLKDTVTQNAGNKSPNLYERRTIVVHDKIPQKLSEQSINSASSATTSSKSNVFINEISKENISAQSSSQLKASRSGISNSNGNEMNDTLETVSDTFDKTQNIKTDFEINENHLVGNFKPKENICAGPMNPNHVEMSKINKTSKVSTTLNEIHKNEISNDMKNSKIDLEGEQHESTEMPKEEDASRSSKNSLDKKDVKTVENSEKDMHDDNDAMSEDDPTIEINNCIRRINELIKMHDSAMDSDSEKEELITNQEQIGQYEMDVNKNEHSLINSTEKNTVQKSEENINKEDVENIVITEENISLALLEEKPNVSSKIDKKRLPPTNESSNENLNANNDLVNDKISILEENNVLTKKAIPDSLISKLEISHENENDNTKMNIAFRLNDVQLQDNSANLKSTTILPHKDESKSNDENKDTTEKIVKISAGNNLFEQNSSKSFHNIRNKIEKLNATLEERNTESYESLQKMVSENNIEVDKSSEEVGVSNNFKENSASHNNKADNKLSTSPRSSPKPNQSDENTTEANVSKTQKNIFNDVKLNESNTDVVFTNSTIIESQHDIKLKENETDLLGPSKLKEQIIVENLNKTPLTSLESKTDLNLIDNIGNETSETQINSELNVFKTSEQKLISGDNEDASEPVSSSLKNSNTVKVLKKKKKKKDSSVTGSTNEASISKTSSENDDKIITTPEIELSSESNSANKDMEDSSLKIGSNEIREKEKSKHDMTTTKDTQQEALSTISKINLEDRKTVITETSTSVEDKSNNSTFDTKILSENEMESAISKTEIQEAGATTESIPLSNDNNIKSEGNQIASGSQSDVSEVNATTFEGNGNKSGTEKISNQNEIKHNEENDSVQDPNIILKENKVSPSTETDAQKSKEKLSEPAKSETINEYETQNNKLEQDENKRNNNSVSEESIKIDNNAVSSNDKIVQKNIETIPNDNPTMSDKHQTVEDEQTILDNNAKATNNENGNASNSANTVSADKDISDNKYEQQTPNSSIINTDPIPVIAKNDENEINISDIQQSSNIENSSVPASNESTENEQLEDETLNVEENIAPINPIRPIGHLRRMSFNTRKQAIIQERVREFEKIGESKPLFLQKKDTFRSSTFPRRTIKQQLEFERRVRQLVSDRKCRTYRKAEIIVQLLDMNFEESEAIEAANECSTFEQAVSYLQQECLLCAGNYPVREIISMVHCSHKACRECIKAYFTIQIRDRTIVELLCPFCNEPDITDEDVAQDYFNHLDIMLKKLVDENIHELFQRKLRDRVLMKDPNFRWCTQCSSGFIADPYLKKLMCPDCKAIMCASCRRLWEREHEGVTCEMFAAYKDSMDPDAQNMGLAKLLTENGIACPSCHFRYALAKGGCMHFKCIQCQHDFCSGCTRPFKIGQKCGVSEFCAKLGLHAHHPRNCLFYLRDKEPNDLQKLLDMNDIRYDADLPETEERKTICQVMEQKETPQGMVDDICGKDVEDGFAGLCRLHYVEYLGQLVNENKIDPIQIFDNDDLELVLRRASIRLPPKKYRESYESYRDKLLQVIEDKLPLGLVEGS